MSPSTPILEVEQLDFSYPARHVFTHWSARFEAGLTWVRGHNGSGKSTLLKLLAGALPARAGRLSVRGIEAAVQPLAYRREVFWCGPGAPAFEHLRPPEYWGFLRGLYPRMDVHALAELAEGFGLAPHLPLRLGALSTGTQRKVWLAAALAVGTAVVLIDEPLNALDRDSLAFFLAQLMARARRCEQAWLVASHESLGAAGEGARMLDLDAAGGPPVA